MTLSQDNV